MFEQHPRMVHGATAVGHVTDRYPIGEQPSVMFAEATAAVTAA